MSYQGVMGFFKQIVYEPLKKACKQFGDFFNPNIPNSGINTIVSTHSILEGVLGLGSLQNGSKTVSL